jgi:hypothetical protein
VARIVTKEGTMIRHPLFNPHSILTRQDRIDALRFALLYGVLPFALLVLLAVLTR